MGAVGSRRSSAAFDATGSVGAMIEMGGLQALYSGSAVTHVTHLRHAPQIASMQPDVEYSSNPTYGSWN